MAKFTVIYINETMAEVEADTFQDGGFEGRWIDFGSKPAGNWSPVLRIRAADVKRIERNN